MEYENICPICWKHTNELLELDDEYMCEECCLEEYGTEQEELA